MTMTTQEAPPIKQRSGGVGINWTMQLRRPDLPTVRGEYGTNEVVVSVDGSRGMGRQGWFVRVTLPVPNDRNRQPRPRTGTYGGARAGEDWSIRIEHVGGIVSRHPDRQSAVDAAYKLMREIDVEALLHQFIEDMWAKEYMTDCNNYLRLDTDDKAKREARIEKIRALRKLDPAFAELFAEPPNKDNY